MSYKKLLLGALLAMPIVLQAHHSVALNFSEEAVTFEGKGYGHGVGMCQCGAIGLSRQGWAFDKILKRYYTDVEIKKLY